MECQYARPVTTNMNNAYITMELTADKKCKAEASRGCILVLVCIIADQIRRSNTAIKSIPSCELMHGEIRREYEIRSLTRCGGICARELYNSGTGKKYSNSL